MNKSGFANGDQLYLRGLDRQRHSITTASPGSPQSVGIRPQHNSSSPGHLQHQGQQAGQQQQQQGQQEAKTQNEDQPQNTSPSKDHRSRSGSKTLKDLFRFRRKSVGTPTGSEFSLPDASNQPALSISASPSHAHSSNSSPKRQRSKSTVVPPNLQALPRPHVIPSAVPPIRQRFAKDNFPKWSTPDSNANPTIVISGATSSSAPLSTSPPSSLPPMSRILQANLGERRDERRRLSIGPAEFMELYRNRTSSDPRQVEARLAAAKVRNRKLQLTQLDIPAPADRQPSPEERLSPTRPKVPISSPDSRSSFPDTIPEHVEVHHGSRNQLLPGSDRMRKKSSGVTSGSQLFGESSYSRRRASEPVKPNLMQLAHLNSIRVQSAADCQRSSESLGGQSATESNRSNSGSRRVSPSSLGICYPLATPQKYLIWRDEETGTTIYKLPSAQGDESDRMADVEFSENLLYVKLMKRHRCYELMPQSSKLILFDKELPVIEAFHALMFNEIRAAPIWDSNTSEYVGMLTVTDFIQVLLNFYEYPEKMEELENHKISTWRELLFRDSDWWETNNNQSGNGESRRRRFSGNEALVCADSDDSLFDAITKLHKYNFHRLLVTDMVENNALYILTYKRILYFICLLTDDMQEPSFMSRSIGELDIGTYNNLTTITPETKLIDALTLLVERRISAIPVIDEDHKIVNIYAKEDALNLVNDSLYKKLDNTVHFALESQRECFEGIYLCRRSDSLAQIIEWIVKENVHRLLVVDEEGRLEGLISLFDIVNFLVLKQAEDDPDLDDIQPGDVEAEMQF